MSLRIRSTRSLGLRTRIAASSVGVAVLLAACEDQGNPGDDNLFTGASLVAILLIGAVVAFFVVRRRRG